MLLLEGSVRGAASSAYLEKQKKIWRREFGLEVFWSFTPRAAPGELLLHGSSLRLDTETGFSQSVGHQDSRTAGAVGQQDAERTLESWLLFYSAVSWRICAPAVDVEYATMAPLALILVSGLLYFQADGK